MSAPPVVLDCQWEPDGRPGASAGCYVAHVRWLSNSHRANLDSAAPTDAAPSTAPEVGP